MNRDSIKKYFDDYIKTFPLFQDDKTYQVIIDNLINYYDDLYNVVPHDLKNLFESGQISTDLYDKLLVINGIPKKLIDELNINDKIILLQSFSDLRRYKSTFSFIKNMTGFYNSQNVYELLIDYDKDNNKWLLKPLVVYQDENIFMEQKTIPYIDVYNEVPSLLINENQLNKLRNNNQLILPFKSNLLLISSNLLNQTSLLYNVIIAIFLKEFGNDLINIHLKDFTVSISLKNICFIWYYLLTKYYNIEWPKINLSSALLFSYDITLPYNIEDLDDLIDKYNSLETKDEIDNFLNEDIHNIFNSDYRGLRKITHEQMFSRIYMMNESLGDYLNERLLNDNSTIPEILSEIYNSLVYYKITTTKSYFIKYVDYLLQSLPQIIIDVKESSIYKIFYNFKPYHTDLITRKTSGILINDKFNSVMFSEKLTYLIELSKVSVLEFSDNLINLFKLYKNNSLPILSSTQFDTIHSILEQYNILEEEIFNFNLFLEKQYNITDDSKILFEVKTNNSLPILSSTQFDTIHSILEQYSVSEILKFLLLFEKMSSQNVSIKKNVSNKIRTSDSLGLLSNVVVTQTFA